MLKFQLGMIVTSIVFSMAMTLPAQADHGGPHEGTTPSSRLDASLRLYLAKGEQAPPFRLIDHEGREISLNQFKGKPLFISFLHAGCSVRCPQIIENKFILEKNYEASLGKGIVFLIVSVDPGNDTPGVLKTSFKPENQVENLYLLTGEIPKVRKVLSNYKINVIRDPGNGRVVWHTALGYAVDREGVIKDILLFNR